MSKEDKPFIVVGQSGSKTSAGPSSADFRNVKGRLGNVEAITRAVLWVGVISVVGVLITSSAMIVDQLHFNNQTYKNDSAVSDLKVQELTKRIEILDKELGSLKASETNTTSAAQKQ